MKSLHPFFSYFGSKYRLAKYYHAPLHDEIIEPFAGSAGYALLYPDKRVTLYEIYDPIVELWQYLIKVSAEEILALPVKPKGAEKFDKDHPAESVVECKPALTLMGFWLTESQTMSSRYPLSKKRGGNWTERKKQMIASQLPYIRHWKVEKLSFEQIPDRQATWFVDPPYQSGGKRYRHNSGGLDYDKLGSWCKGRNGQVIVCEQDDAKWLPFRHLELNRKIRNASNRDYKELVWYNY